MQRLYTLLVIDFLILFMISCNGSDKATFKYSSNSISNQNVSQDIKIQETTPTKSLIEPKKEEFLLNEDNAISFFYEYTKSLKENKVKLETTFGTIIIELFDNVPYHKANFIYLTKKGYFDHTYFHRVVKNFIIQGGNADIPEVSQKRSAIGRYLLPPDTKKGHRHHRGVVSMPSSAIDNPHKLASPYEFFIVVTNPGSYHLDGGYTPFGRVIEGMEVVDLINSQEVDSGDWPMKNIVIKKATAF